MKSIEDVFQFMSGCSNLSTEFKSRMGTLIAEVYADGWKSGHKVGRDNAMSAPINRNVTTDIQDEVMAAICLEYDSVLRLLTPHLWAHQRAASANAFGEAVRPAVAKAISSAWDGGFKLGAESERKACLGAIEFAANNIVRMPAVEHGGVRTPIPTILDRELLKNRERWEQWPNIMRHEYVQARLVDGKPRVQIVVNGEYKGTVAANGTFDGVDFDTSHRFFHLALRVALADAREKLSPEGIGETRVPDSRVGLFLFIDSKGNEFELKNTDYGTVIVKGEVVIGKVYQSKTDPKMLIVRHTECALRMCEEFGALTRTVFAFCRWACDPGALPKFTLNRVDIPEHHGLLVRHDGGRFQVHNIHNGYLVMIEPYNRGAVVAYNYKASFVNPSIIEAAVRTIRSKFYGDMA